MSDEDIKVLNQKSGAERRRDPRIDARIEVQISTNKEFEVCYSQNISRGGIFLETHLLPDPNAKIELVLNLKSILGGSKDSIVKLQGRVVRLMSVHENSKTIHKVGIQFIDIPAQTQVLLDQIYESVRD